MEIEENEITGLNVDFISLADELLCLTGLGPGLIPCLYLIVLFLNGGYQLPLDVECYGLCSLGCGWLNQLHLAVIASFLEGQEKMVGVLCPKLTVFKQIHISLLDH